MNDNKWILAKDRIPNKEECGQYGKDFQVTVNANELITLVMKYQYDTVRGKEVSRWSWKDKYSFPWEVIAWKPLSEPYNSNIKI